MFIFIQNRKIHTFKLLRIVLHGFQHSSVSEKNKQNLALQQKLVKNHAINDFFFLATREQ